MDPVAESQLLIRLQGMDIPAEAASDPSLWQLKEARAREDLLFQNQSGETRDHLQHQAARIAKALMEGKGELNFRLPGRVSWPQAHGKLFSAVDVPEDFREQKVSGFLGLIPVKDARTAFRGRLAQLENSGYTGVSASAALLRFAIVRQIVHDLIPEQLAAGFPAAAANSFVLPEEPKDNHFLQDAELAIPRLRDGLNTLHQAVSLAPYMYADEEYQGKRDILLARMLSLGHAVADGHLRNIVRTIRRRADADDLNRGLRLSLPYFDDRALEMKLHEFEVIPPGRTMFVPAFVALAAAGEQEKIGQEKSLSPSTRVHLLAELKSLEQAFDTRPR